MENVKALLNTSVADAKSTLECQLLSNPQKVFNDALLALDFIDAYDYRITANKSRRAMLNTIVNKARKQLSR